MKTLTRAVHYYASPEETPPKMEELMLWLRENQEKKMLHTVALAATFHYRFVAIHPFDDGNGRMSRLLMNLFLMQDGYPPVMIRQEDRNAYYAALRQADAGNLEPFVAYIGENMLHSLEIYLRGAKGESIEEPNDWGKQVELLKRAALGNKSDKEAIKQDKKEQIANWLTMNFPIIWKAFLSRFKPFDSFFDQAEAFASINWLKLAVEEVNWLNLADGIINGRYSTEIYFTYECQGFRYARIPFEPQVIILKIENNFVLLGDQKWLIDSPLPIFEPIFPAIDEIATTFYKQIEAAIT